MANKDTVEFGRCPVCESAKLKRKGDKLVCGSKNCDYEEQLFGKKSLSWLAKMREDITLWKRSFSTVNR